MSISFFLELPLVKSSQSEPLIARFNHRLYNKISSFVACERMPFLALSLVIVSAITWSITSVGEKRFFVAGKSSSARINSSFRRGRESKFIFNSSHCSRSLRVSWYWMKAGFFSSSGIGCGRAGDPGSCIVRRGCTSKE